MLKPVQAAEHDTETDKIGDGIRQAGSEKRLPLLWAIRAPILWMKV